MRCEEQKTRKLGVWVGLTSRLLLLLLLQQHTAVLVLECGEVSQPTNWLFFELFVCVFFHNKSFSVIKSFFVLVDILYTQSARGDFLF